MEDLVHSPFQEGGCFHKGDALLGEWTLKAQMKEGYERSRQMQ